MAMAENHNNDYGGECASNMPSSIPTSNAHFQSFNDHSNNIQRASDLLVAVSSSAEVNKAKILDLAFSATEELRLLAQERESLWLFDVDIGYEVLNQAEYKQSFVSLDSALEDVIRVITGQPSDLPDLNENVVFQSGNGCMPSYTAENMMNSEGSRANGVVFINPISLVSMFMDVEKWSATFSNIVSKAINLALLTTGNNENKNGCLQVIFAEFHISSPLIKPQQMYFVRHSRQIDNGTWVVADVSLETIFPIPMLTSRRRPSGCVIQALQDGISMVTWVEHNAECRSIVHSMFKGLIESGVAFNAKRWISTLERQCDRTATLEAHNESLKDEGPGVARNGLLKLAEKMFRYFNFNVCSNMGSAWRPLNVPGGDDILIKTSFYIDDQQITRGVSMSIAASAWLPVKQNCVFTFLRNEHNRTKWDILSRGLEIQDIVRFSSARNSTDSVSVVAVESSSTRTAITYLQESFCDSMACYVAYAPVDVPTMHHILRGSADPVAILPSGLVVLPDGLSTDNSILTVAFQVMDQQLTTPEELLPQCSMLIACSLIKETFSLIQTALLQGT